MLDQNTDRMWYVIGAVIVGAAIIFIANGTLPEIFASIGNTFSTSVEDVQREFETYGEDLMKQHVIYRYSTADVDMSEYALTGTVYMKTNRDFDGIYLQIDDLALENNKEYVLRYSIQRLEGPLYNVGGHTDSAFLDNTFYINGQRISHPYMMMGGDREDRESDYGSPVQLFDDIYTDDPYEVKVYFTTPNEWQTDGFEGHTDYGGRIYIQANRGYYYDHVKVAVRNIELVEVIRESGGK